ncbi:MAG: 1-(5-phosphoribosyl)-5-[(5-phosphoribosylamino)methylideneamino]imidazole-4-carboxamide isomerase [Candidatus Omnitrophota bacterium]|nr:MAG: 1-(5-phosphoribosyl)-5-[(5-phosphoribosylamino)methylideneamino]imidazole-4-carboxamide isomerase [Candidatus Omnitrophota bacterium]
MKIIPAIDLWEGKVVRLVRGDPNLSTVYSQDPLSIAKKWAAEGAQIMHLVDLSAALAKSDNMEIIEEIIKEVKVPIEVGGGIRTIERAKRLISLGAERIIVGTKSTDEEFLDKLLANVDKTKVAVSVDLIEDRLAVEGWKLRTNIKGNDFINYLREKGLEWIIYTDISRDGTLEGPNIDRIKSLGQIPGLSFIISGGISSLDDIKRLQKEASFVWGVIVGKALYEGVFSLPEAIFSAS